MTGTLDRLPRFSLAALPTPLERAPRLSRSLGVDLWIKRDDLTGLAFGGNKVRKLEFLVGDALEARATCLLTTAAVQSNFCRVAAAAANRAGLRAGLLLRGSPESPVQGNLLLDYLLGAEVRFTDDPDPYSADTRRRLEEWAEAKRAQGERPYVAYPHGRSRAGALATVAYVQAALELNAQCRAQGVRPRHLYVAVGSGSTLAGLLLGARTLADGLAGTRIVGVCVGSPSSLVASKVREFVRAGAQLLDLRAPEEEPALTDRERGEGYGIPTPRALRAIRLAALSEALLLNPVYTGKALAALLDDVARGAVRQRETVVFLNTGGDPLVFAYATTLEDIARCEVGEVGAQRGDGAGEPGIPQKGGRV
jgi:D-cysteine desulfhydrase family pyridoxal phosphate-dependent enzyme